MTRDSILAERVVRLETRVDGIEKSMGECVERLEKATDKLAVAVADLAQSVATLKVKGGLIGTIAAILVACAFVGVEWLKSAMGVKR